MRRVALVPIALAGGALSIMALTWCGSFSVAGDDPTMAEAGADVLGSVVEAGQPESSIDGGCRLVAGDPAGGAAWTLLGNARSLNNGSEVQLTADAAYQVGGMVHTLAMPLTSFRATIRLRVGSSPSPADGVSFFWSPSGVPGLGESGDDYGFCGDGGPGGTALTITTKPNDDDAGKDTVAIRDPTVASCVDTNAVPIPPIANGTPVTFVIEVGPTLGVHVREGSAEVLHTQLANAFPILSFGITGATGGDHTEHVVESAIVEVCP